MTYCNYRIIRISIMCKMMIVHSNYLTRSPILCMTIFVQGLVCKEEFFSISPKWISLRIKVMIVGTQSTRSALIRTSLSAYQRSMGLMPRLSNHHLIKVLREVVLLSVVAQSQTFRVLKSMRWDSLKYKCGAHWSKLSLIIKVEYHLYLYHQDNSKLLSMEATVRKSLRIMTVWMRLILAPVQP
jgi:hypothetical protein